MHRPERTARNLSPRSHDGNPVTLHTNPAAFAADLPARGSLLALDLSPARLGFAGTDAARSLVTPLRTLQRRRLAADLEAVIALAASREAAGLVVGWPLNMDGSAGRACDQVRSFLGELRRHLALPVLLQDERLTTAAVEQAIGDGLYPRRRRGEPVDDLAAAVILEDALRAMRQA